MSPSAKKSALVRRSIVELDLVGYSHVARSLEDQTDARVLLYLNDQVQGFVDDGLREVGCARKDVVNGTAGDNALLAFERASEAHRFSEAVHRATAKHNATKTDPTAHRHFRIGISTGEIGVRGKEISGTRIIESVRLEAAGKRGHILIDEATYEELPAKFQQCYRGPESVADKQNNSYRVYRFAVVEPSDAGAVARGLATAKRDSAALGQATCPVDISRIIRYAPAELIGREADTKLLSDAWDKTVRCETKRPHILTFVALGGEGKTSLVAKWAAALAHADWPGCDAVFGWSFYSQGTREQMAASSDLFLKEALTFFGDSAMAGSAQGAFDKGRRLAHLVGERRALLILDGVEPLQYPPVPPMDGKLKDDGIAELLKGLAATNHGLCVVTTRYSIPDLRAYWQTTALEKELKRLSREAGVALLQKLGVRKESGSAADFERLVEDVQGHALTLNLLATYLHDAHAGDIRKRDLVKLEEADAEEQGGHAFRVMDAYVRWFESEGEKGKRAIAVLRLLGLFDRPATADCLAALERAPAIPGLTEALVGMSEAQRNVAFTRLEAAKLLTVNREEGSGVLITLDAHPLLREYFARRVRQQQPEAWRAAHRRLFEHLCATTTEGDEPTLEDLQPLYQAVAHGCLAGLHEEARAKVYGERILRGSEHYTWHKLGAYGSELGAQACFFEQPWKRLAYGIDEGGQAWLFGETAFCLRALGRLTEALDPVRAAVELVRGQEDWANAARAAYNLSALELTLGEVAGAVRDAEQSMTYSDRSGDAFMRRVTRTGTADALHHAGRRAGAEVLFREAEALQVEHQPEYPLLYSLPGFQYCDLLLTEAERAAWQHTVLNAQVTPLQHSNVKVATDDLGRGSGANAATQACRTVSQRAAQTLQWVSGSLGLLTIAHNHLTLGCAALYEAILGSAELSSTWPNVWDARKRVPTDDEFSAPYRQLDAAVADLRRSGNIDELPRGLLIRAWLRFLTSARTGPESAQADLDEAWEIAERGPMRLHMADIHLYRARLFHDVKPYPWTSPQDDLAAARKLIEQCGYWRRKEELEDAEAAAKNW